MDCEEEEEANEEGRQRAESGGSRGNGEKCDDSPRVACGVNLGILGYHSAP